MYKEASSSAPSIRKKRFAGKNDSSAPSGRALSCAANRQKQPVLHREANHHRTVRGVPYPSRPPLRREATLSGAKESWGVARGDRKPWCPIPFCPLPPGGGNAPPSEGEIDPVPGNGVNLASYNKLQERREISLGVPGYRRRGGGTPPYGCRPESVCGRGAPILTLKNLSDFFEKNA